MNNEMILQEFIQKVWNEKNFDCIPTFIASAYRIYCDLFDPWNGRTLSYEEYAMRLDYYFDAFPDINFQFQITMADVNAVTIIWIKTGTNSGKHGAFPPTGKSIRITGSSIYYFNDGKICGHTQVFDSKTVTRQIRFLKNEFLLEQCLESIPAVLTH